MPRPFMLEFRKIIFVLCGWAGSGVISKFFRRVYIIYDDRQRTTRFRIILLIDHPREINTSENRDQIQLNLAKNLR